MGLIGAICRSESIVTRVLRGAPCANPNLPKAELAASASPDWPAFFRNRLLETVFMGPRLSRSGIMLGYHCTGCRNHAAGDVGVNVCQQHSISAQPCFVKAVLRSTPGPLAAFDSAFQLV